MKMLRVLVFLSLVTFVHVVHGQEPIDQKLTPTEREAIRQIIREEVRSELRAEQNAKKDGEPSVQLPPIGDASSPELRAFFANGFRWESADRAFQFRVGGRLEWDNAWFTQDDNLLIGPSAGTRFQDGTDLRRARLRADGTVWQKIDFVCEVNFANIQDVPNVENASVLVGSVGVTDFYLTFRDLPCVGNLRLGHFVGPFGLERFTSANFQNYMERSSIFDAFWGPNMRQSGVMIFDSYFDDRITSHAAFTRVGKADVNNFAFGASDGTYAAGLRLTGLPYCTDDNRTLIHLGANYFHQSLIDNTLTVANRFPLRGGAGSVQVPNLLATGKFFTPDGASIVDFEAALIAGPFSLCAEYAIVFGPSVFDAFDGVAYSGPRGNVSYQATYLEAGFFLTPGDRRRYDRKSGTWDRTLPAQNAISVEEGQGNWQFGHGAVEVVARVSYLDLVSGNPSLTPTSATAGARAGRETDLTLGVNWYLNPMTRIMINYVASHVDSVVPGASGNVQGFGTRLHFDF